MESSGETSAHAPVLGAVVARSDVDAAVRRGCELMADGMDANRRARILVEAAEIAAARREEIARTISDEVDKPISLARAELDRAVETLRFSAMEALGLTGRTIPMDAATAGIGKVAFTQRVPRGVIGAITPFNFPLNLVAHKVAPALAAGCTVVLKPAPQAPGSAMALAGAFESAGLPEGWFTVLPGEATEVGVAIIDHPEIPVVSFTGSAKVGWEIAERAPRKKVLLELGGSAPVIVADDADLGLAAAKIAANAFSYAGQSCVSVQRVYVGTEVADEFLGRLLAAVAEVRYGDPADPDVTCGPLIDQSAVDRLGSWIESSRGEGARLLAGGEFDGRLLAPTVLADVPQGSPLIQEEAFGPVLCVRRVESLEEGFELANETRFGLQAGVFTDSLRHGLEATRRLRFGAVLVNEVPTFRADHMPYGGGGDSGNTREGPAMAVREFTEERLAILDLPQGGGEL